MLTWVKSLFVGMDRAQAASERIGKAMEDIAGDVEGLRDAFRARLLSPATETHMIGPPLVAEAEQMTVSTPAKKKGSR